jgi:hypothetical protein
MRATADDYRSAGLVWRTEVPDDASAALRGVGFLPKRQIADFAPDQVGSCA